jgi:lipopolysaccharide export system permease protein
MMLIFLLQSVWLYISELAGKALEIDVIFKFLLYVYPRLMVLVLPLTILLSSIMVFGNFAENYEFAAMKSTGISLQRAMRSLSFFIVLLAITTFFFANNVIPAAEFKFYNLRRNIAKVKPAMIIAEGQFNEIGSINIKVAKKSGENGKYLEDVIIHQKKPNYPGNYTVIKSLTGELTSSLESDVLQLVLYNGNYYDAPQPKDYNEREVRRPFIKSSFEKYILNIDLSRLNNVDFNNTHVSSKFSMLRANELGITIDSLKTKLTDDYEKLSTTMYDRTMASTVGKNVFPKPVDTVFDGSNIFELYEIRYRPTIAEQALTSLRSTISIISAQKKTLARSETNINKHIIALYEKFAFGFACIILFFVGAPLGALIKKGGMGLPIVIAVSLFLTYHFIGIFAKNSAEDSSLNPILATWLSTLIMLPLSIYLTNRATKDRTLVDIDALLIPFKKLVKTKSMEIDNATTFNSKSQEYKTLESYSDTKLMDVLKNYKQYDMNISYHNTALAILNLRGITKQELRYSGKLFNENYENAFRYKTAFNENSRVALLLYVTYVVFGLGGAVLNNNGFPVLGPILIAIGALIFIIFLVALFKSFSDYSNFYVQLNKPRASNIFLLIFMGILFYFIYRPYLVKKMNEDIKEMS